MFVHIETSFDNGILTGLYFLTVLVFPKENPHPKNRVGRKHVWKYRWGQADRTGPAMAQPSIDAT